MNIILTALRLFLMMTLLTGLLYPLAVTGVGQVFFSHQANGSVLKNAQSKVCGSELLAQKFDSMIYFQPRPSACGYETVPSYASNQGFTSAGLQKAVQERRVAFRTRNGLTAMHDVPADMVFTSGSGLDPHISPESARLQIDRIAKARGFSAEKINALQSLVENAVEPAQMSILGAPRVNVLKLNLALDTLQ
jgi:K+-transporting ATPase ATPase C chain